MPVDYNVPVATSFLGDCHKGMGYVHVFIGVTMCACYECLCLYCVSQKKEFAKNHCKT